MADPVNGPGKMLDLYMLVYHIGRDRVTNRSPESIRLIYTETEEEARSEALKLQGRAEERGEQLTFKYVQQCPHGFVTGSRKYPGKIPAPSRSRG